MPVYHHVRFAKDTGRLFPKPFVKWLGGKRRLLPHIVPRLPHRFGCFHEPFIGGGALFFALKPEYSYISDSNGDVVNAYNVIKHKVHALIADLRRHVARRDYYYALRDADRHSSFGALSDVARASRFIFLNKTCFNGLHRVNTRGQFNAAYGKYRNPAIFDPDNLIACHHALRRTRITHGGFLEVERIARAGDFVYFDPPYLPISGTSNFVGYAKGGFGLNDHLALRGLCLRLDAQGVLFMVSNSYTSLVRDLYQPFWVHTVFAPRSVAGDARSRGMVKEVVITNY